MVSWFEEGYMKTYPPWSCQLVCVEWSRGDAYLSTEAAVALDDGFRVRTVL